MKLVQRLKMREWRVCAAKSGAVRCVEFCGGHSPLRRGQRSGPFRGSGWPSPFGLFPPVGVLLLPPGLAPAVRGCSGRRVVRRPWRPVPALRPLRPRPIHSTRPQTSCICTDFPLPKIPCICTEIDVPKIPCICAEFSTAFVKRARCAAVEGGARRRWRLEATRRWRDSSERSGAVTPPRAGAGP